MDIKELNDLRDENISGRILQLLTKCNYDFVPPLSARNSTLQSDFTSISGSGDGVPYEYFEMIKNQNAVIAEKEGKIVGFMSFRKNLMSEAITKEYMPNIYISTIITDKAFRRQGVTKAFYGRLLTKYYDRNIFTRTWSTNISHISLLSIYGFTEYKRITDDRGKGTDTVYYIKKPSLLKNPNTEA